MPTAASSKFGGSTLNGPDFSRAVGPNGYAWWYIDALSDDGAHGLTIIAFIGSVFSPYYARARRSGVTDPENHCAINVALYGKGGKRWALTERGRNDLTRTPSRFAVGPSNLTWDGTDLVIDIDEITVPWPSRLKGRVRLTPSAVTANPFVLNANGQHMWHPIAPLARVTVEMTRPHLSWTGNGYFDSNSGDAPLEDGFVGWTWSRASTSLGTQIYYDGVQRSGHDFALAIAIDARGQVTTIPAPPRASLPTTTVWRIPRATRADAGTPAKIIETCEDTPFYARSITETIDNGRPVRAMHESLLLDRFSTRWVQSLLHFRMPRRAS